jgi:hypothetical protein
MQAVAEVIIGPEHVRGVLGEVLVAEGAKRAAKVVQLSGQPERLPGASEHGDRCGALTRRMGVLLMCDDSACRLCRCSAVRCAGAGES